LLGAFVRGLTVLLAAFVSGVVAHNADVTLGFARDQ
jgi:hypothetical protein